LQQGMVAVKALRSRRDAEDSAEPPAQTLQPLADVALWAHRLSGD
jgi:hypothetical protein